MQPDPVSLSPSFARLERMSREELEAEQLAKLQRQIERAFAVNPFYRDRFAAAGVAPEQIRSLDDFRSRIPTCNKADFLADQQAAPPFGRRLGVPRESVALVNMTGGTSGQGQEVYGRTQHDIALQGYFHYLPWYLAGLRPGQLALNCVPSGGLTTGGWGPPEGFRIAGATAINAGGTMSTEALVDLMLRFRDIGFIYTSTNYLHTLTEAFRRRGILPRDELLKMTGIIIVGEGYPPNWARNTAASWGCTLHEGYGSTQGAGFVATSCEQGVVRQTDGPACLHMLEWENFAEIVDPATGKHVAPGEEGEIVLTNLTVIGSPVIRFASGDKARFLPHQACSCGRPWNCIEAGTVARYDDMMKIRGNNVWPATVDAVMFSHPEVAEYAGRVFVDDRGRTEIELRFAVKPDVAGDAGTALAATLCDEIKARTNVMMTLSVVPRDQLPTFTYKARRWTDERKAGYAGGPR